MKIVLDTNVLISAFVFGGKPRSVFDLAIRGECDLFISPDLLEELRMVLLGKKFRFSLTLVQEITNELCFLATILVPSRRCSVIHEDPDDNRVLECALEARADVIVSGDLHLLTLGQYEDILMLNPETFLRRYHDDSL